MVCGRANTEEEPKPDDRQWEGEKSKPEETNPDEGGWELPEYESNKSHESARWELPSLMILAGLIVMAVALIWGGAFPGTG